MPRDTRFAQTLSKWPLAVGGLILSLAFSSTGFTSPRGHGRGGCGPQVPMAGKLLRMYEHLDLTEPQEVALVRLRRNLREEKAAVQKKLPYPQIITDELNKAEPNRERLSDLITQRTTQVEELAQKVMEQVLDFHATLSEDQRAALTQMVAKRQKRRLARERREHR